MDEQAIEQEIQARGLTAPRLSPADLDANIVHTEIVHHVSKSGQVLRWAILTTQNGFAVVGKPSVAVSPENDNTEIGVKVAIDNSRDELWPLMGYQLRDQLYRRAQFDASPKTSEGARMQKHAEMIRASGWMPGNRAGQQDDDAHVGTRAAEVRRSEAPDRAPSRYETTPPPRQARAANLPPHQKRVIDEKRELDERKEKLEAFFDTPTFAQLDADEQGRLHAQRGAMAAYARILSERISAFAGEDAVLDASSSR